MTGRAYSAVLPSHGARRLCGGLPLQKPIVSVVMAVRDGAAFLGESLDSVRAQTFEDLEAVVVDDGSTDRSPEILADFARIDERVRVVRQHGDGLSLALNRACSEARGRYLARLDADDVALPERLALQIAFLEAHPDVAVVGGAGIFIDEHGMELGTAQYPSDADEVAAVLDSGRTPLMHPAATMRAAAFHATSGYRAVVDGAEDYDLWMRIASHGRIANLPEVVIRYRLHGDQSSTRSLHRTATAAAAARRAAQLRANGDRDPLDDAEALDHSLLEELGVRPEDVAAQEVDYALWLARTLARGGRHDRARPLWSLSMSRAGATAEARATRARVMRARADACGWQGQRVRGAALRVIASALDPGAVAGLRRLVARHPSGT
jgi:glycosyltransferase involved in cell wall biosynthesis